MSVEGALCDRLDPALRLIETFGHRQGEGFIRLERHLARLERSAKALRFPHDEAVIGKVLRELELPPGSARIRLTLGSGGEVEARAAPFQPLDRDAAWTVRIAQTRLQSCDPLLAHKTSRRGVYEAARAEFMPAQADEVLLRNERGELCEGTITNLFVSRAGRLLTPPLASGLLPGILRAMLIQEGRAVEHVLFPHDLAGAELFVGNSLRGLIPARLA